MIHIKNIHFSIEGRPLFEDASASLPLGHKIGLVGRNGIGKTTLFHLLTGHFETDSGSIELPTRFKLGEVKQEAPSSDDTLIETVIAADLELAEIKKQLETETDNQIIADLHVRFADLQGHSAEARASILLSGLGFSQSEQHMPCHHFSGGWRMRVALAGVLFAEPDLLLLDEPSNYLDLEGMIWLQAYLVNYPHTVIIISHDRELLNNSVNSILHLQDRKLTLYQGNFDRFDATRRARLELDAALAKKQAERAKHLQSFVDRFRYKASKAKQAQSRIKMLEKMQPISLEAASGIRPFHFPEPEQLSPPILRLEDAAVGYDGKPVLQNLNLRIDQDDRIALLGANGQGKSTLSKLLSDRIEPLEGRVLGSKHLRIGYFAQHQLDELNSDQTPLEHLQAIYPEDPQSKLRARLAQGGIMVEQADTLVGKLSGGQKARLSLLLATLDAPHLLILDEPTNHLDMESREALSFALSEYRGAVILVSHDPHLVNSIADQLWLVKDGKVRRFDDDLSTYQSEILSNRGLAAKSEKPQQKSKPKRLAPAELRKILAPLKAEVAKCVDRIEKLQAMRSQLDRKMAEPDFYIEQTSDQIAKYNAKRKEIDDAVERAETLWLEAEAKLEEAQDYGN